MDIIALFCDIDHFLFFTNKWIDAQNMRGNSGVGIYASTGPGTEIFIFFFN